ncbi:MAG TPA: PAC2 family protein [Chloroflexota bacterium]|nr:PAC2 family protein [Chloroflexota bacterium]
MSDLILHERPELKRPVLIVAFGGWGDAGHSATLAVQHLVKSWPATKFGEIDPDGYYDFTVARPRVKIGEDGQRQITWPSNTLFAYRGEPGEMDAILLLGIEPSLRWRSFAQEVVEVARSFDASMVVTLGAHFAPVSHADPVIISGWASPKALHERMLSIDIGSIGYEGPTGIATVVGSALADAGIPVAALWAGVPAYLGGTPNPKGALALVTRLERAFGLDLKTGNLNEASQHFEASVTQAIERIQSQHGGLKQLPAARPEAGDSASGPVELPSPEDAVRAAEEFLRKNSAQ